MSAINTDMKKCRSQSRCRQIDCAVCARRYAGRLTKLIQATVVGKLFLIEVALPSPTLADFSTFRIEARNFVDYRRCCCRWWREFMLHVWFGQDGRVRGVGSLGSLTSSEVLEAFLNRWPTTLRTIAPENLTSEIVSIIRPGAISSVQMSARYQSIKFAIWPSWPRARPRSLISTFIPTASIREPMPVLF
jgi:hypothetical protein